MFETQWATAASIKTTIADSLRSRNLLRATGADECVMIGLDHALRLNVHGRIRNVVPAIARDFEALGRRPNQPAPRVDLNTGRNVDLTVALDISRLRLLDDIGAGERIHRVTATCGDNRQPNAS